MIFKSFELNFKKLLDKNFFLIYGENLSLISEIEEKIIKEAIQNIRLRVKRYQEEELLKNPEIIYKLVSSNSLFEEEELTIISKTSEKIIDLFSDDIMNQCQKKIIFTSSLLAKKSKLRTFAENSKNFACIPCYNDTPEQLQIILTKKLKENNVSISRKLLNSIFETNTLNRKDISDVIEKVQLLQKTFPINEETLKNIFYSSNENDNFEIINYCLLGDTKNIKKILANVYFQGVNFIELLAALKYKINKLINILESNNNNLNIGQLVESYKPQIFWKDKIIIKNQLNRWSTKELYKLQKIIFETEIICKRNYEISATILQNFIVAACSKTCLQNNFS